MPIIGNHSKVQFQTVIFATDFSEASRKAGLCASVLSIHFATNLIVAHAFTLLQASLEVEAEHPLASAQRKDLSHALAQTAGALQAGSGAAEPVLIEGDPRRVIPDLAERRAAELVVMGTHGRGVMDRSLLGSTAEGILRRTSGPALTVGPNVELNRARGWNIRRILYATDCSMEATNAAPFANVLVDAFGAQMDVVNVADVCEMDIPDRQQDVQQHVHRALESVVPQKAEEFSEPATFVVTGDPQAEILKHIDDRQIDLLIVGLRRDKHLGMKIELREFSRLLSLLDARFLRLRWVRPIVNSMEHRMGFEPMNTGFADQRVSHFAIGAFAAVSVMVAGLSP